MSQFRRAYHSVALVTLTALSLGGCGIIADRSGEYIDAQEGQGIVIPEELTAKRLKPRYPIPEIENQKALSRDFELPEPPDATAAIISEPYKLESSLGETWLQLFTAPSQVWPLMEVFWDQYDIELSAAEAKKGYQATVRLDQSQGHQSFVAALENNPFKPLVIEGMSFQARIVHGVRRNTSEVQIRALLPNQSAAGPDSWLKEAVNPRLEKAVLDMLGSFLSSDQLNSRHSYLASEIGGGSRVRLLDDGAGQTRLELDLSLSRAFTEIEQALGAAGVVVAENRAEQREIYISYLNEEEMVSWYHTDSMVRGMREEKNYVLSFSADQNDTTLVEIKQLNPEFDAEIMQQIMAVIFEHIS